MSAESPQGRPVGPQVLQQVNQQQAVADATQTQQVRSLATLLAPSGLPQMTVLKAVVTAINFTVIPRTFSANIGGDNSTVVDSIRFIDSYVPVVGDTCLLVKIGPDVFGIGQLNNGGTPAQNGWQTPSLGSGFTSDSFDPVLWRLVYDNGDPKIQLRGKVNITGTPTALWTMPTGYRPLFNKTPVLVARGYGAGSVAAQIQVNADGTVVLTGSSFGIPAAQHGNLTTSYYNVDHYHVGPFGTLGGSGGDSTCRYNTGGSDLIGVLGGSSQDGGNSTTHRHTTDSATHTHTVGFPDWVGFNGVEYFL